LNSGIRLWLQRLIAAIFLGGQAIVHLLKAKINRRNTMEQMAAVGPDSLWIALITAAFVGMVFTIQVAREFLYFGAGQAVGGVLALALTRELAPVLTAVVIAGRVGSAFAAEIGTMRVTEQIDALYILKTDPIDYLVLPRVIACSLYGISQVVFLDSVRNFMHVWDLLSAILKSIVFGGLVAVIGCSWGLTTTGGAKGVGQSTTTAVVTALLAIFIVNFFLSWLMFQGTGSALTD
jgi:phospholipid/cholesterol/gamma-HCH transport system permease protein